MKPLDRVKYVLLNPDNTVAGVWTADFAAYEGLPEDAARVLVPLGTQVRLGDTLDLQRLKVAKRARAAKPPPLLSPTFQEKRASAYPPLNEFAEALTEKEMGDDTKWRRYLKTVKQVRASIPKP